MKKLQLKKHALTGISYMIPVVVAGGLCLGLAKIFGGLYYTQGSFAYVLEQIGVAAIGFTVSVVAAGIAYSIAERPGIAPGLAVGVLANSVGAGFLGGLIGGFMAGGIVLLIKKYVKVPQFLKGLMPVLVIPLLSTLAVGLIFTYVVGGPVAALNAAMTSWLLSLADTSGFLLGCIIGGMRWDMGGPCAQAASAFCDAMIVEGVFAPKAASMVSGMTPPVGVALAVFMARKRFTRAEFEAAKTAVPLGLCFITEGVFPFLASDPLRIIISCTAGSALSGGLAILFGCQVPVPAGGIFAVPFVTNPWMFLLAFVVGCLTTALLLILLKPKTAPGDEDQEEALSIEINI